MCQSLSTRSFSIKLSHVSINKEIHVSNLYESSTHLSYCCLGFGGNVVQCPSTELVDSFYSNNSKWLVGPVVMDYNPLLIPPVLEFYTHSQFVGGKKSSLELYGKQRYMSRTATNFAINIDKNITELRITLTDDQQAATTTDQLPMNENNSTYPKVTRITIDSKLTRAPIENDKRIR
jgi:hypothetical protein